VAAVPATIFPRGRSRFRVTVSSAHHGSYEEFERMYPKIELLRGRRFVEHDHVATAGGLTSGIDLALRVVERYLGKDGAVATARYLEYARTT
jgi:transcriptional regulator GlxA family with amidase domain